MPEPWDLECDILYVSDEIRLAGIQRREKLRRLEEEKQKLKQMVAEQALDTQARNALTEKAGMAKSEMDSGHRDGRALWVEPVACVSVSETGSEQAPVSESLADNPGLRARMREITEPKQRYGCPPVYVRLRREGWRLPHRRLSGSYRAEVLSLRGRARKKATAVVLPCGPASPEDAEGVGAEPNTGSAPDGASHDHPAMYAGPLGQRQCTECVRAPGSGSGETTNGKLVHEFKRTYMRHGRLNLFATLEVAIGEIPTHITRQNR